MRTLLFIGFLLYHVSIFCQRSIGADFFLSRAELPMLISTDNLLAPNVTTQSGFGFELEQFVSKNIFIASGFKFLNLSSTYQVDGSGDRYVVHTSLSSIPLLLGFVKPIEKWQVAIAAGVDWSFLHNYEVYFIEGHDLFGSIDQIHGQNLKIDHFSVATEVEFRRKINEFIYSVLGVGYQHGIGKLRAENRIFSLNRFDMKMGLMAFL